MSKRLILASSSAQRKLVLQSLGVPFTVEPADIDEKQIQAPTVAQRVPLVAAAKGQKVASQFPDSLVLAADSVIAFQEKSLEKPRDVHEAAEMLQQLSGNWFEEYTGHWCALPVGSSLLGATQLQELQKQSGQQIFQSIWHGRLVLCATVKIRAKMRTLSDAEIHAYVKTQPVTTWAGGFSPAYHPGAMLVSQLQGSFTGFAYGFAVELVSAFIEAVPRK